MDGLTENLQDLLDRILYFALSEAYQEEVRQAGEQFAFPSETQEAEGYGLGFNQWLIHDYRLSGREEGFAGLYRQHVSEEALELLESVTRSRLSVFQVMKTPHGTFLKDVLTRQDYGLKNPELFDVLDFEALHLLRLYPVEGGWAALEEGVSFDGGLQESLRKGLMEKYSEFCRMQGPVELEAFVYENPLLLYKFAEIAEAIELEEQDDVDLYTLYQSVYVYKDIREMTQGFERLEGASLAIAEEGVWIYRLQDPELSDVQLAEILLSENRMEVECNTPEDRTRAKGVLEAHFGSAIAHLQDENLDMDDLIGGSSESE